MTEWMYSVLVNEWMIEQWMNDRTEQWIKDRTMNEWNNSDECLKSEWNYEQRKNGKTMNKWII